MRKIPEIKGPKDSNDFHDSSLIHLSFEPVKDTIDVVLSTPDEWDNQHLFLIKMSGILRVEFETLGTGDIFTDEVPPEIYDVYFNTESDEYNRWVKRLNTLEVANPEQLHHIIFASSFLQGWGERESIDGIEIICRRYEVMIAPDSFSSISVYPRLRIPDDT